MYNWIAHEDHLVLDKKIRAGVLTCRITVFFHRFTVHQVGCLVLCCPVRTCRAQRIKIMLHHSLRAKEIGLYTIIASLFSNILSSLELNQS